MCMLHVLDQDLFVKGFSVVVSLWDKCFDKGGDYVEK